MNTDKMVFDSLEPVEVSVTIAGKNYTLREASGDAAVKYRSAQLSGATLSDGKVTTKVSGLAGLEPLLVALCLFDDKGKSVPETLIRSWPARIQKQLFNRAKEISELDEAEDTVEELEKKLAEAKEKVQEAKNESSDTTGG